MPTRTQYTTRGITTWQTGPPGMFNRSGKPAPGLSACRFSDGDVTGSIVHRGSFQGRLPTNLSGLNQAQVYVAQAVNDPLA